MGNKMINIIASFLFLILFVTIVFQYTARYVYNYRVNDSGIKIVVLGTLPIIRMPFSDIIEIRKISLKEALLANEFSTLRFGNRILGDIVLIRKSKGLFKTIIITPDNSEMFINDVNQHRKP
jgi:hypothetical protein